MKFIVVFGLVLAIAHATPVDQVDKVEVNETFFF